MPAPWIRSERSPYYGSFIGGSLDPASVRTDPSDWDVHIPQPRESVYAGKTEESPFSIPKITIKESIRLDWIKKIMKKVWEIVKKY